MQIFWQSSATQSLKRATWKLLQYGASIDGKISFGAPDGIIVVRVDRSATHTDLWKRGGYAAWVLWKMAAGIADANFRFPQCSHNRALSRLCWTQWSCVQIGFWT